MKKKFNKLIGENVTHMKSAEGSVQVVFSLKRLKVIKPMASQAYSLPPG